MEMVQCSLPDVLLLRPRRLADARGWFSESHNRKSFAELGLALDFVQDNLAFSQERFTLRGLHFQRAPRQQAKLVRVQRGRIFDVVLDLRRDRPTFGQHATFELSADEGWQLFAPAGFAHGYLTLEAGCEVVYKVSDYYDPVLEAGVLWCDPALAIAWPCQREAAILSEKDARLPCLSDLGINA